MSGVPLLARRAREWQAAGSPALIDELSRHAAVVIREALPPAQAARWAKAVRAAKRAWVADFGGDQFSLGRAFYTHFETDRSELYFREAARSDALVEQHTPGLSAFTLGLLSQLTGFQVRPRRGFCGPGVHVFPAGGIVARRGGVVHFDVEGLSPVCLARGHRALSLVIMLDPPEWGGGLKLWQSTYRGREHPTDRELAQPARTVRYGVGDALLMSSYRLHQIRPFRGDKARTSITVHAEEVDRGVLETWF